MEYPACQKKEENQIPKRQWDVGEGKRVTFSQLLPKHTHTQKDNIARLLVTLHPKCMTPPYPHKGGFSFPFHSTNRVVSLY